MKLMYRMKWLVEQVSKHAYNYYVLDSPTISDKEFDLLYDELVELEKETGVILPDSPTQRVGGQILSGFKKYPHKFRLYSLDKCQTKTQLNNWINDIKKSYPEADFTCEYKFDGLSLVCTYKNGFFVSAGTRGNGFIGEDVTQQAKTIKTVPLKIDFKEELIVQGEAMITLSNLAKFNQKTNEPLKNARNAVAGAIRNLDPKSTAKRNLDWFAYTIHFAENKNFKTQAETMQFLKENNFNIGDYFKVCKTADEIFNEIDKIDEIRKKSDILMDGVVIRLNNIPHRDEFGFTAKFPKWAMAFKFEAEEVSSLLKNVIWNVGRTGKITPIAEIEPVELAGATIKRATLNNIGDIRKKRVEIGSRVFIRRSNEVIPEVLGLAEKLPNSQEIIAPTRCPCCNFELVESGANLYCYNIDGCKDQIIERLTNFASKEAMNIEGLSISTITALYEKFNIRHFSEIFDLTSEQLLMLEGFKKKKTDKIIKAIQKAKNVPFHRFITSLNIGGVGVKTSKDLSKKFSTLEALKNAELNELLTIYNIGEIVAGNVYNYFRNEYNINQIEKLFKQGIVIEYKSKSLSLNTVFNNKMVVLTGSLQKYSRIEATSILEKFNAQVTSSVSKNTDFVVYGENSGSKLDKAKSLGIKLISEQEFYDIISQQTSIK
ncbi:MAG: NAD-dependent DNA ligase LigA [Clostridia bacterium]|nr:NAD-dependent DNA ligase LigA [Clostridia bacterium]MDD4686341.1 NAD-dependent DNA ligase LigA [Clostridia bacterium]